MVKPKTIITLANNLESQTLTELRDWVMSAGDEWAGDSAELGMMNAELASAIL